MARNPHFDILFEPVRIGPVTAPNRFYQTPHAIGMDYTKPLAAAALRGIKAEGGWGVVCTEYCSIHPGSDDSPYGFQTLWDDDDVRALSLTVDAIHHHGSLAGVELWHGGSHTNNRVTREPLLAPSEQPAVYLQPGQARAMGRDDIRNLLGWQRDAALRARSAGFDIVYVYAGHDYLPFQFLSPATNRRTDEYGGSLENRVRLFREMIEVTKDAVGDTCAIAVRLGLDEVKAPDGNSGEGREIVEMLADLPDLWDVNLAGGLGTDSRSARFSGEGYQESTVAFVKSVTSKPVVSVGRYTSPDKMAGLIRRGVQDFIGAARPSIADPFLPNKIAQGREDEIRECIGCNICRAANNEGAPIHCTQNPTMGEEWRRGWHPDRIQPKKSNATILVVGAGPAGLEASLALGQRGYNVVLAEAAEELGGRIVRESSLPGLATWARVRDYRAGRIGVLPNVEVYRASALQVEDVLNFGAEHVVLATGSHWRRDGIGARGHTGLAGDALTPDDVFAGASVEGTVVIYDDEHYFMGGALAERLVADGHEVTIVTPEATLSAWTAMTDEQAFIQAKLMNLGVVPVTGRCIVSAGAGVLHTACVYTGEGNDAPYGTLILVTGRLPDRSLYDALTERRNDWAGAGLKTVTRIGDCLAPSSIADAVYAGHRYARELDEPVSNAPPPRERPTIEARLS